MKKKEFEKIYGFAMKRGLKVRELTKRMKNIGFQATQLSKAVDLIRKMRENHATIFLSFTSNMVSSGLRELFAYVVKNKMVNVIVTAIGSVEEDFMKTKNYFLLGDFDVSDVELRKKGINRIGNIFVPDDRYIQLEKDLQPFFEDIHKMEKETGKLISPSDLIYELGKRVQDENSILYWATKNNIPIFCPSPLDGAFGLQLYFFNKLNKNKRVGIDITADMDKLADIVYAAKKTGGIILGGGAAKHFTIGANIVRGGMDYAVYISTGTEYDGSLSGARPREAKSWGKLKEEADSVFVECDATIAFPLIVGSLVV